MRFLTTLKQQPINNRQQKTFFYISIGLVFLVLILSYIFYSGDYIFSDTLSVIGRERKSQFLIWSIIIGSAFSINLKTLALKLNFSIKTSFLLDALIILNLPLAVLQAVTLADSVHGLHFWLAIAYTAHSLITIIAFLAVITIKKSIADKKYYNGGLILFFFLAFSGFGNIIAVNHHDFLIAFWQLLLVCTCMVVIAIMNFIIANWRV